MNQINECRDAALGLLKPSRAVLEHGLELHRNSLVIDAYGFAPEVFFDPAPICAAAEEGASDDELRDLCEDMWATGFLDSSEGRTDYLAAWEAAGVTCIVQNAGEEYCAVPRLVKRLARFTYLGDVMRREVGRAACPADILGAGESNSHCLYFSANAVPLSLQLASAQDELKYVRILFQLGIRFMHLTYNRRNLIGDGCAETADAGLSDFGRAAIREMNRVGVIVDTAHAGWQTTVDAAQASEAPVVASHTACWEIHKHCRCKPDEVIRAIAQTGGYVGICCIGAFLGDPGDINAFLDHIDYAVKLVGTDHVAIGTDYVFRPPAADLACQTAYERRTKRDAFTQLWPPGSSCWTPMEDALSLAWTNWPLFTVGLVQRGYTDEDIQKIVVGNVLRVTREALDTDLGRRLPHDDPPSSEVGN